MKWMSSPGDRDSQGQGQSIQAEGGGPAVIKAKVLEILLLCHSWERISLRALVSPRTEDSGNKSHCWCSRCALAMCLSLMTSLSHQSVLSGGQRWSGNALPGSHDQELTAGLHKH